MSGNDEKLPRFHELTIRKFLVSDKNMGLRLCHGRIRLQMRIVKVALSSFPDTQTSKVEVYLCINTNMNWYTNK